MARRPKCSSRANRHPLSLWLSRIETAYATDGSLQKTFSLKA